MNLKDLAAPFRESEHEWRIAQSGERKGGEVWAKVLCYITARAVMDRLDEVCGPENWRVSYDHVEGGVMCHLAIRCENEWIVKSDGAEKTEIESFKGGISGALKRAAVCWGIGRLLYNLPEHWADCSKDPRAYPHWGKTKNGTQFSWRPPSLAREAPWAVAGGDAVEPAPEAPANGNGRRPRREAELSLEGDTAPYAFPGADVTPEEEETIDIRGEYMRLAKLLHSRGLDVRERGYQVGDSERLGARELGNRIREMKGWLREFA